MWTALCEGQRGKSWPTTTTIRHESEELAAGVDDERVLGSPSGSRTAVEGCCEAVAMGWPRKDSP